MRTSQTENSTERLLSTIRRKQPVEVKSTFSDRPQPALQISNLKKNVLSDLTLGVFLSPRSISFVLTSHDGNKKRRNLIKWSCVELPESLEIGDETFPSFLYEQLTAFSEGKKGASIWCCIESSDLKLRHIDIPDVEMSKVGNAAFWGLKKEMEFDPRLEVFDYKVLSEFESNGVKKKKVLAWIAKKDKIDALKKIFINAGFLIQGITALPFAMQNYLYLDYIPVDGAPVTVINLSREHSEIFCFSDQGILFSRILRTDLFDILTETEKISGKSMSAPETWDEDLNDPMFANLRLSCERLVGKITRTGEYCSQNYANNIPVSRYIFFGDFFSHNNRFIDLIRKDIPVTAEEFTPAFNPLPGTLEVPLPDSPAIRNRLILTYGIALSANTYTPNFIYTSEDKLHEKKEKKINLAAAGVLLMVILLCLGIWGWQDNIMSEATAHVKMLEQKKNDYLPGVDIQSTVSLLSTAKDTELLKQKYIDTYLPLAMIGSLCSVTPDHIKLGNLETIFAGSPKYKTKFSEAPENSSAKIILSGSIFSRQGNPEADLTQYMIQLEDTDLFGNIDILQKKIITMNRTSRLKFKLSMDTLR